MKYYDIRKIMRDYPDAYYYVVVGERSNGKTYSSLDYALERATKYGEQFAYVRRWGEDIRRKNLTELFAAHSENMSVFKKTDGTYTSVAYMGSKFYLEGNDEKGRPVTSETPIGYAFDLNSMEHYKSISFPKIKTIIFDEFLSRNGYLPNEFILFTNTLSTIIRQRNDVKIIMLGNTVNKSSPYFEEMGLTHIKEQKQGTVDIYHYGKSGLQVAVEYCESTAKHGGKKSDVYFAFDNPELQMITEGSWEISIYPHLPVKYRPKDVIFQFFILFENDLLHAEIVSVKTGPFIFIHRKTTPIKDDTKDIVYTTRPSEKWNFRMCMTKQSDLVTTKILRLFKENKVFYADNEVGEIVRNYMMWSDSYDFKN